MARPSAVATVTIVALVLGGLASVLAYNFLKNTGRGQSKGVVVVAANSDIPIGGRLTLDTLKLSYLPKEALTPGYHTDPRELPGRVAVRHISAGDVINETKLMPQNAAATGGVMTYIVPQGHRAVTVAVNEVAGVAGFITPNSRVDVVLTTPLPGRPDTSVDDNISKVILQNVPVLACGQVTEQKDGKPVVVPTVTLDLIPDDAERLIVGAKKGSLQLLLRNIIDVATVDTKGSTIVRALGRTERLERPVVTAVVHRPALPKPVVHKAAVPARSAPPKYTIEVIRGGVKSTRELSEDF